MTLGRGVALHLADGRQTQRLHLREQSLQLGSQGHRQFLVAHVARQLLREQRRLRRQVEQLLAVGLAGGRELANLVVQLQQAVGLRALNNVQFVLSQSILPHTYLGVGLCGSIDLAAHSNDAQRVAVALHVRRDDLRARLREFVFHETAHVVLKKALPDYHHCHHGGRNHRQHDDGRQYMLGPTLAPRCLELVPTKPHQAHTEIGGEGNEDGIDEEQVESAEEVEQVAGGQSVASSAERRHQCRGDGYAGNDVALVARAEGYDACRAAAEGDEHVVERRRRAGQQFRLRLAERRDEEVGGGRQHTDDGGHDVVLHGTLHQVDVVGAHGQSHADDGSHEGRNEHSADDDCRRIDIQAKRGNEDGKDEHPEVGTSKRHAIADLADDGLLLFAVGIQVEADAQLVEEFFYGHGYYNFSAKLQNSFNNRS